MKVALTCNYHMFWCRETLEPHVWEQTMATVKKILAKSAKEYETRSAELMYLFACRLTTTTDTGLAARKICGLISQTVSKSLYRYSNLNAIFLLLLSKVVSDPARI